jgi:hypothetical protein
VISRFKTSTPVILLALCLVQFSLGQKATDSKDGSKEEKKTKPTPAATPSKDSKNVTPEQIAESTIFIYGGRAILNQIRKTAVERGKVTVTTTDGKSDQATYQRFTQRAETISKDKVRIDQEFPNAKYSLVFNEEKIFGIVDYSVFTPREDASKAFENQIVHGLEALLRYKENESKIESPGKEKIFGVEYYLLDVTDKQSRRTRFYISTKTFRVMMLDYEQDSMKYRRKFYDYNYAQGTLVPHRTTLWAGDKMIEETEVGTISFGQKIDETMFSAG